MNKDKKQRSSETKRQTAQNIIDAAHDSFVEFGYAATPITLIAERAGITPKVVYEYFKTKVSILDEILSDLLLIWIVKFLGISHLKIALIANN